MASNDVEQRSSQAIGYDQQIQESVPLLLHVNSDSSGLVFNYYYSYLDRQITTTNNIFFKFSFTRDIDCRAFPDAISIILNTFVEDIFLEKHPSTETAANLVPLQSKRLKCTFDRSQYQAFDGTRTIGTFSILGAADFGVSVERISIWQDGVDVNSLNRIQLTDDVREWNEEYQPCSLTGKEEQALAVFENQRDVRKKCYIYSIANVPDGSDGHEGISTMKKTTDECYKLYKSDSNNAQTKDGRPIGEIRIVPVYYIIMPSSCQFGPSDTNNLSESEPAHLTGILTDPNVPDRIQIAYANHNVLRSRPMKHFNRYLRRTFYSVDEDDRNGQPIRYLFCAEYPYILSILDHLEKYDQISKAQKYDEYLRFCNMLDQLIQFNNLSESIKLIQYDDEEEDAVDEISYADYKTLWNQIKENIDQWYDTSENDLYSSLIETRSLLCERSDNILLFYTYISWSDPSIRALIENLKRELERNGFSVRDLLGSSEYLETEQQIIYICAGNTNDKTNHRMMDCVERKINKYGVLRDVFILVNDAIRHFPHRFIRFVPYLSFDLERRSPDLNKNEVQEVIYYLKNMNVMSTNYTNIIQYTNDYLGQSPLQCTSVSEGCGAAFYFNYIKLIVPLSDHRFRLQMIEDQFHKNNSIFIRKWVFIIPWTIKNTTKILPNAEMLSEDEQQTIGFHFSEWKPQNATLDSKLYITVGGIFQREYSGLRIYKLTNLTTKKTFYFPMEVPAALHGLENKYQNILSHFHFGNFDPLEQAKIFRRKVEYFMAIDPDKSWHENILLVPLDDESLTSAQIETMTNIEQSRILLRTLWQKLES